MNFLFPAYLFRSFATACHFLEEKGKEEEIFNLSSGKSRKKREEITQSRCHDRGRRFREVEQKKEVFKGEKSFFIKLGLTICHIKAQIEKKKERKTRVKEGKGRSSGKLLQSIDITYSIQSETRQIIKICGNEV